MPTKPISQREARRLRKSLNQIASSYQDLGEKSCDRIAELEAELAEVRKDTERLNWLETKGDVKHYFRGWHSAEYPQHRHLRYKSMREAIDAAMEKQP